MTVEQDRTRICVLEHAGLLSVDQDGLDARWERWQKLLRDSKMKSHLTTHEQRLVTQIVTDLGVTRLVLHEVVSAHARMKRKQLVATTERAMDGYPSDEFVFEYQEAKREFDTLMETLLSGELAELARGMAVLSGD